MGDQLAQILSRRTDGRPRGALLIAIDETQEAEQEAIERVCNAAQQLRSRGFDVSLILSGVPLSHPRICSFEHCIFVNRMECVRLGCMSRAEAVAFLQERFARVPEVRVSRQQVASLADFSHGHPYLMQLVGDMTYRVAQASGEQRYALESWDVDWVCAESLRRYRTDVLSNVLVGVPDETVDYLRAVADLRDLSTGLASVDWVNERVGSGAAFSSALDTQIVDCPEEGYLRLTIPYFDYAFADPISASLSAHPTMQALDDWVF